MCKRRFLDEVFILPRLSLSIVCLSSARAGSGTWASFRLRVERIDPLRFLAGCRKRLLKQALSVLCLSLGFFWAFFVMFTRATFVLHYFVFLCVLSLVTLRAKRSGAVYCNRSCLWRKDGRTAGGRGRGRAVSVTTITRNCVHRFSPNWVFRYR